MKQEEILEIENQAWAEVPDDLCSGAYNRMLTNFAAIIENNTLEKAAELIDGMRPTNRDMSPLFWDVYDGAAQAIRALKETK